MAGRVLSRRAMRDQNDESERIAHKTDEANNSLESEPKAKRPRARKKAAEPAGAKPPAKPRARKKSAKEPPRMFARWAVCDGGMKRVAVFDYKDRAGANAKLAQMQERKSGSYFLQLVKDAYEPPAAEATPAG